VQQVRADVLVPRVHAMFGNVLAELMAKVSVVVQQCCRDHDRRLVGLLRKRRALQSVL
jgi:hypothetical protein